MILRQEFEDMYDTQTESYDVSHEEHAEALGATFVTEEIIEITRWGQIVRYIYERDNEFVAVKYEQDGGDADIEYSPTFTSVKPKEITKTIYV